MKINDQRFFFGTVIIHFWDKPCQEINFKSHSSTVLLYKVGKMLSDLHISRLVLFYFTCLCSILQWFGRCQ